MPVKSTSLRARKPRNNRGGNEVSPAPLGVLKARAPRSASSRTVICPSNKPAGSVVSALLDKLMRTAPRKPSNKSAGTLVRLWLLVMAMSTAASSPANRRGGRAVKPLPSIDTVCSESIPANKPAGSVVMRVLLVIRKMVTPLSPLKSSAFNAAILRG